MPLSVISIGHNFVRCLVFRILTTRNALINSPVFSFIDRIAKNEGLSVNAEAKEALEYVSKGDLRALTNVLQSLSNVSKTITSEATYANAGALDSGKIKEGLKEALSGNYLKARETFEAILDVGVNMKELLSEIFEILMASDDLAEAKTKSYLIEKLAETDYRIVEGATPYIQFQAFIAFLTNLKN